MKYYLAPMEGITGYIYRNAYHACYRPMDQYIAPFIVPKTGKSFSSREKNDLLPEHNPGMNVVPQILTRRWEEFIRAAEALGEWGYREVNLNLGCPSATVVSKGKGAGFLAQKEELDQFLDQVCRGLERLQMQLSVKTRLGMEQPEEFETLLSIYNHYPLKEVILHPRVREDYYKNPLHMEMFQMALENCRAPLCYNGDLFTASAARCFLEKYPRIERVMFGRGVLMNPELTGDISFTKEKSSRKVRKERLFQFHQLIYEGYCGVMSGERNVLFKMKELWSYLEMSFPDQGNFKKKIKKSQSLKQYEEAVNRVFRELELLDEPVGM